MRVDQWRALSDLLLQAVKESATEHEYCPTFGMAYAAAISELKKAERKERESNDHSS